MPTASRWHTRLRTATPGRSTNTCSGKGNDRRNTASNAFLATRDGDESRGTGWKNSPKRWHVEEFFNAHQSLGLESMQGLCNLNIRYAQMTMGLLAQAAIAQFRKRLAPPATNWDAKHMCHSLLRRSGGGREGR